MSTLLSFEDLHPGDQWTSQGRTVTETDVVNFAGLTGDFTPIHVDHEYARETPFRKPIAHGLLGLSFLAGLSTTSPAVETVAFIAVREWKFCKPIFIGDTVHAVTEVEQTGTQGHRNGAVIWRRKLINQEGLVVQEGTFETLVARAIAKSKTDAA
jgi:3-hydroxybutyryl-CoA dehydratase